MPDIKQLLHGARLIGVGNVWRSIAYAYRRDRLEARYPEPLDQRFWALACTMSA